MENENSFIKITNKTFAVIFTVMFIMTIVGIVFNKAYWHIPTLFCTGIFAILFWTEKECEVSNFQNDKR